MIENVADGNYRGIIRKAYLSSWDEEETEIKLVFVVELQGERAGGEEVTCSPPKFGGEYERIAFDVIDMLGLVYPSGLEKIGSTVGMEVPIKIKRNTVHGKEYVNAYIQTVRPRYDKELEPDKAKQLINKLAGRSDGDDIPF